MTNAQMQVQQIRESINRDRDRRLMIERQIEDLADFQVDPSRAESPSAATDVSTLSAQEQLRMASARLADVQRRLTSEHPDVRRARRLVADLDRQAAAERERAPAADAERPARTAAEASRRSRTRQLQIELAALDRSISGKQEEEHRLQAISADYQRKVDAAPMRQSELTALMRDYDTVSQQYKELLTNSKAAEMSEDLERRQGGEQFRLVEEARVPQRPASPRRLLIVAGSAAAGLALGLGFLGFFEFRDSSLRRRDDVLTTLGLPVLAVIPVLSTTSERRSGNVALARRLRRDGGARARGSGRDLGCVDAMTSAAGAALAVRRFGG